jgi:hypothetical protein
VSGRRGAAARAPEPRAGAALHHDPLGEEQILERFYRPEVAEVPAQTKAKPKPTHYKIVCISLYTDDIERLERMVGTLKSRGHTKANKSQLIRAALDQVDLDKVPRSH